VTRIPTASTTELTLQDGIKQAVDRAFRERGISISVFVKYGVSVENDEVYVCARLEELPVSMAIRLHCVAQFWSENERADGTKYETVQLRYEGGRSEWVER
jgi:hypothetical protein